MQSATKKQGSMTSNPQVSLALKQTDKQLGYSDILELAPNLRPAQRFDVARKINGTDDFVSFERILRAVENIVVKGGRPLVLANWSLRSPHLLEALADAQLKAFPRDIFCGNNAARQNGLSPQESIAPGADAVTIEKFAMSYGRQTAVPPKLAPASVDCPPECRNTIEALLPEKLLYLGSEDLMRLTIDNTHAHPMTLSITTSKSSSCLDQLHGAGIGHSLMLDAAKESRSIWFVIARSERNAASAYFRLASDIKSSCCSAPVDIMARAPFPIHVLEQSIGDLVILPSLGIYKVQTHGSRTVVINWSRITFQSLDFGINQVLPAVRKYDSLFGSTNLHTESAYQTRTN